MAYPTPIKEFLLTNGFIEGSDDDTFRRGNTIVKFCKHLGEYDHYEIQIGEGSMFSPDLQIYWVIGVLTYYGLIPKDYVK